MPLGLGLCMLTCEGFCEGHLHTCLGVSVPVCVAMFLYDIVLCMYPRGVVNPACENAHLSCKQAWVGPVSVCVCLVSCLCFMGHFLFRVTHVSQLDSRSPHYCDGQIRLPLLLMPQLLTASTLLPLGFPMGILPITSWLT